MPPPRGRVAVPGCGRGHDARFLASHGYETVGFDFAAPAVDEARRLAQRDGTDVPLRASGGGPPFPIAKAPVRRLLTRSFRIERQGPPPRPVAARAAQEWMVQAVRRVSG
jgi:hypothetical protein